MPTLFLRLFAESLAKFPRKTNASPGFHSQAQNMEQQLPQPQQTIDQNANGDQSSAQAASMQLAANNGVPSANNSGNPASTSSPASTIVGLLHQNSMNSRQQNSINSAGSPYAGNSAQISSPGSSTTIAQAQANSSFQSPTLSSPNNHPQSSIGTATTTNHMSATNSPANVPLQQPTQSSDADQNDSQSSVQKIIQEYMMSNHLNGMNTMTGVSSIGDEAKTVNGMLPGNNIMSLNGRNGLVGTGTANGVPGIRNAGYGSMSGGLAQASMVNGMKPAMGNNSISNGRIGMASLARGQSINHQDLGDQLLNGLGAVNGFNNLQFDY